MLAEGEVPGAEECSVVVLDSTAQQQPGPQQAVQGSGISRRPVCWSLHKYFQSSASSSERSLVAVQAEPLPEKGWKQPLQEKVAELQEAVQATQAKGLEQVQAAPPLSNRALR